MSEELILTVDVGTGSIRAIVFNSRGDVVAKDSVKNNLYQEHFNWAVQRPKEVLDNTIKVCKSVIEEVKREKKGELIGWTVSTYYHSLILVDKHNEPITDILTWADLRANRQAEEIKKRYDSSAIYKKTGCPMHPMYPLFKLMWFLENYPDLKDFRVASAKDYLVYSLFGEWIIDETVASTLGFLDINSLRWDEDIIRMVGIDTSYLPEILSPLTIIDGKRLKIDIEELKEIPFILGAGDGALSSLGMGAIDPGDVGVMVGTSGAVRTFSERPVLDEKERIWCYYFANGLWLVGGAINNGGIALRWLRDGFFQDLTREAEELGIEPYDLITRLAEKISPGAEGLIVLPFLTGERSPFWNDKAQGSVVGFNLKHNRSHLIRAVMESVCYRLFSVYSALKDTFKVDRFNEVRAGGGFSRSSLWLQIMADVFGERLLVPALEENTSLGAFILSLVALDKLDSFSKAKDIVKIREMVNPNMNNHSIYAELYDIYLDAYWTLSKIYKRLYEFKEKSS